MDETTRYPSLWALAGQGASSLGKEVACKATKCFRQSYCHTERRGGSERVKKTGWVSTLAWDLLKGLRKGGYQAASMGAVKAIQSDLAQKKAMEFISPLVGDTMDKLGNKVGGEELMKQSGTGSRTYHSGTDPCQEGGLLPLLGKGGLIPELVKQMGGGGKKKKHRMPITASSIPSTLQ